MTRLKSQQIIDDIGCIADTVGALHELLDKFHASHGEEIYGILGKAWPDAHRIAGPKSLYELEKNLLRQGDNEEIKTERADRRHEQAREERT